MSGETLYEAPRRHNVSAMRVHDYLYDSSYIVSGARDYARSAFRAAMASAQVAIQPVYRTMFSELRHFPRIQVVYHPNCRLPPHVDRSYGAYLHKVQTVQSVAVPQLGGKDRFKFAATPKKVLPLKSSSPEFLPTTSLTPQEPVKPRNRGTQSIYRESSAQTSPWQPDAKPADNCLTTPEVLYLDKLEWGPGCPYRKGDLPADFHTTEIINKMRHARKWTDLVEKGGFPNWMKKRDAIITDIETKDWIFREAEIDELQSIRQALLQKIQTEQSAETNSRISKKLATLWNNKKDAMERKIQTIHRNRDRELRKLSALHRRKGRLCVGGGGGDDEDQAPRARLGCKAKRRHANIQYDTSLLELEEHTHLADPPAWLQECGQNLTKTCSGHHLPRDTTHLCERETKWSEQFLENLHEDLKKARLGAAYVSAGPLKVLKPRHVVSTPRPSTPEVEPVPDDVEASHQSALLLQRVLKGRAVQNLMFEGRTRTAELTEELKTTHGLQKEDKIRITKKEAKARDFNAIRDESEQKEEAITALVEDLCGEAVSSALDFLEKELRRLKDERRQHAFILIAIREKTMREAAEAGRRQKEEHRRREHDEMFKQVLGVTQNTVDTYLRDVLRESSGIEAEINAISKIKERADHVEAAEREGLSTAEQNELVAELVQQFLLPSVNIEASRNKIQAVQGARLGDARKAIFGMVDKDVVPDKCDICGNLLDDNCKCLTCSVQVTPIVTTSREDPRWKFTRHRQRVVKSMEERYPPSHELRCLLNCMIDDAIESSRYARKENEVITRDVSRELREKTEILIDAREVIEELISRAVEKIEPVMRSEYKHYMRRIYEGALERTAQDVQQSCAPKLLPSELRRLQEEQEAKMDPYCHCVENESIGKLDVPPTSDKATLLPSELRILEDFMRCKCDAVPTPDENVSSVDTEESDYTRGMYEDSENLE